MPCHGLHAQHDGPRRQRDRQRDSAGRREERQRRHLLDRLLRDLRLLRLQEVHGNWQVQEVSHRAQPVLRLDLQLPRRQPALPLSLLT